MDCSYTSTRYPELRRPQPRRVDSTSPEAFSVSGQSLCGQRPACGCTQGTPPNSCGNCRCDSRADSAGMDVMRPNMNQRDSLNVNNTAGSQAVMGSQPITGNQVMTPNQAMTGNQAAAPNQAMMGNQAMTGNQALTGNQAAMGNQIPAGAQAGGAGLAPAGACTNTSPGFIETYPIGIGYVPWQQWGQTYPLDTALQRGTLFPELDLPFMMGRCQP